MKLLNVTKQIITQNNLASYTCYHRDRSNGHNGGGVLLLVEKSIPCT